MDKYLNSLKEENSRVWTTWLQHLLEVSILVLAVGLQHHSDGSHERFDHTELQCGLFAEAQEANGVGLSLEAAGAIHTAGPEDQGSEDRFLWTSTGKKTHSGAETRPKTHVVLLL